MCDTFAQNEIIMDREEILRKFEAYLENEKENYETFEDVCSAIGVSKRKMNRILMDCVGYDGEKLVKCYKLNVPIRLL